MRELGDMECFRIGGTVVNNLRYADDTVIVSESGKQLPQNILEQVRSFNYLGSLFSSDARYEQKIRRRIRIAKSSFTSMNKVLTSRNIDMAVRIRVIECYVWSTLLYGCEAWTLSSVLMKKREAFETWLYRKMLRISWKERITNLFVGMVVCISWLHSCLCV